MLFITASVYASFWHKHTNIRFYNMIESDSENVLEIIFPP